MNKKLYAIVTLALAFSLLSPVLADVFVPPGPRYEKAAYITPTLGVFAYNPNTKLASSVSPIGWDYTDDVTFNPLTRVSAAQIDKEDPAVFTSTGLSTSASGITSIPYGTFVEIIGFVPRVTVAVDQVPPPVEIQINWNGIPNTVTLTVPANQVVGINYPPTFYPNRVVPYEFAYPSTPKQNATYNLWVGNYQQILQKLWGITTPPTWFTNLYGLGDGEWFWYTFMPNVGDYIALDSNGQIKGPPTYDITAMFEYGTSQIWFNHVNFNVNFLQIHKDLSYCDPQVINDVVTITNVGVLPATNLDLTQTFPSTNKLSIVPVYTSAMAQITSASGAVVVPWMPLPNYQYVSFPNDYNFTAPFNTLAPGQTLTVTMMLNIYNVGSTFVGTIVFDSMCSATQIPPWKAPIGLEALVYPMGATLTGPQISLWSGLFFGPSALFGEPAGHWDFENINAIGGVSSIVIGPILRIQLSLPMPAMTLDPEPVPLIAGETQVTAADVALVKNALHGLGAYDERMDTNGNGRVDVQDLKAFEAAVA